MNRHLFVRRAGIVVKLIAVLAFLGFVAVKFSGESRGHLFRLSLPLLIAAILVNQLALFLFALRMQLVLRIFSIGIGYFQSLRIHLQSMLYYFVVPMTIGLEAARFAKIKNRLGDTVSTPKLGAALVGDRLIGAMAAVIWAGALVPVIGTHIAVHENWNIPWVIVSIACGVIILFVFLYGRIRFYVRELIGLFRAGHRVLYLALGVALFTQLLFSLAVYLAVRGTELHISFIQTWFTVSVSMLFIVIPVSVAGLGPAEAAGVSVMVGMGVSLEQAAIFALLAYFARLIAAFEGGIWELYEGGSEASRQLIAYLRREHSPYE